MNAFCYNCFLTLIHSFWQSLFLMAVYFVLQLIFPKQNPIIKRNLLFGFIAAQLIISGFTLFVYETGFGLNPDKVILAAFEPLNNAATYLQKISPWLFSTYCLSVFVKLSGTGMQWFSFRKNYLLSAEKPLAELRVFTSVKAMEFGINKKVSLWYCNVINTPVTFGFFKPVILLPVALVNGLSIIETESLIIHELTHIKNNDYLLNWVLIVADAIYFFNPFMKILVHQVRLQRELSCDIQVIDFSYPGLAYAETLLKTARFKANPGLFQLRAVFTRGELLRRIRFFTAEKNLQFNRKYSPALFSCVIISFFFCAVLSALKESPASTPALLKKHLYFTGSKNIEAKIQLSTMPIPLAGETTKPYTVSMKKTISRAGMNFQSGTSVQNDVEMEGINNEELSSMEENFAIPVAAIEPGNIKEVIIREENAFTGIKVTKAFRMTFEDGEWIPELLWMMTEEKPKADSNTIIEKDQLQSINFPLMQ